VGDEEGGEEAVTVYFIKSDCGRIKIGYTMHESAANRVSHIQVASPRKLELLVTVPGDRDTEKRLHRRFSEEHVRGEWFRFSGRIQSLVEYIRTFGKTEGWEGAHVDPEGFATHVESGNRPEDFVPQMATVEWKAALERGAEPRKRPLSWKDLYSRWTMAGDTNSDSDRAEHRIQDRESSRWASPMAFWFDAKDNLTSEAWRQGVSQTAWHLLDLATTPERTAALWMTILLHQWDSGSVRARYRFPEAVGARDTLAEFWGRDVPKWHARSTIVVPRDVVTPDRSLIRVTEFVEYARMLRDLVWGSHRLMFVWPEGYYEIAEEAA
jgi:hypothetical protein